MAEPEIILIEHYKAVREEEMERIRHRDQYLILFIMGSGIITGVYISNQKWWGLLIIIPFFAATISLLYSHTDVTLGSLSHWLRYDYTRMVDDYKRLNNISYKLDHWDGSIVHKKYVKGAEFALRYLAVSCIMTCISGIAIFMSYKHVKITCTSNKLLIIILLCLLTTIVFIAPLWAWRKRIKQA